MSQHIKSFWKLFNEILSQITERDYTFNHKAIMVGENGTNYCAIRQVFGVNFMTTIVVSCQMHYTNDINRCHSELG